MLILSRKRQAGIGMIEALIALLIISIGLLGIAALQIVSMKQSASANWHSQAVFYNYEMVDRINANRQAFVNYAGIDTDKTYGQDCQSKSCTFANMAVADAEQWTTMVDSLPEGRGFISEPTPGVLTVSIMWNDGADSSNCTNGEADNIGMTCFAVTIQ